MVDQTPARADSPGGVARDFTVGEAQAFVAHVRASVADIRSWIIRAVKGRAWLALGYESWDAMCEAEFDGAVIRLPREDRREFVGSLREAGLSTRAIGTALGISQSQADRDVRSAGDPNGSPAASPTPAPQGLDGKTYPTPPARPRRTAACVGDPDEVNRLLAGQQDLNRWNQATMGLRNALSYAKTRRPPDGIPDNYCTVAEFRARIQALADATADWEDPP